jgi:Rieske 2Fe-2S family protein
MRSAGRAHRLAEMVSDGRYSRALPNPGIRRMTLKARAAAPDAALDTHIANLIARQPSGRSLLQEFYSDPAIYARDLERIHLRQWLCVGHESRIPNPGDYFLYEIAGESLIVVRGRDAVVRALVNVCRHRGSHVCYEKEGNAKVLVCPYHAWSYELDGELRSARKMDKDVEASDHSLATVRAEIVEGLIFVSFAAEPFALDDVRSVLGASLGRYGWASARMAHRELYAVDANWKLAVENYFECYHCGPAHPEFARHHATESWTDPNTEKLRKVLRERSKAMGVEIPTVSHWPFPIEPDQESAECFHDATYPGSVTGSENGQGVAPLMGDFSDYEGGFTYADVGPASFFLAYSDYGVLYLFTPRDVQKSEMEVVWLVRGDAREGVDYDLKKLIWMWDVTSIADKRIIDHNQRGVNSRYYRPGPYGEMESHTREFTEWYLAKIAPPETP